MERAEREHTLSQPAHFDIQPFVTSEISMSQIAYLFVSILTSTGTFNYIKCVSFGLLESLFSGLCNGVMRRLYSDEWKNECE